jgi:hypothetical protein
LMDPEGEALQLLRTAGARFVSRAGRSLRSSGGHLDVMD